MYFRGYFIGVLSFCLFIWQPIVVDWKFFFLIELGCIFLVSRILFSISGHIWERYNINKNLDFLLSRILSCCIASYLLIRAYFFATMKNHLGNTMRKITRDGYEDLGHDIILPGPDYGLAFLFIIFSIIFFRHAASSHK